MAEPGDHGTAIETEPDDRLRLSGRQDDPTRVYKYLDIVTVAFATVAVCSNLMVLKITRMAGVTFGGGVLFFPISYILDDVLTEVYGFRRAARVIWIGFGALVFAAVLSAIVVAMPTAPDARSVEMGDHFRAVFGSTPRIAAASILGYLVGQFVNAVVMAVLKVRDEGAALWRRVIASTVLGQIADSLVFYPLAFAGVWGWDLVWTILITHYVIKVLVEVLLLPVTYRVVAFLKRAERVDHYDREIDGDVFAFFAVSLDGLRRSLFGRRNGS
jgi:uncharacterized integral membrane protein (TIGR00697 family)